MDFHVHVEADLVFEEHGAETGIIREYGAQTMKRICLPLAGAQL